MHLTVVAPFVAFAVLPSVFGSSVLDASISHDRRRSHSRRAAPATLSFVGRLLPRDAVRADYPAHEMSPLHVRATDVVEGSAKRKRVYRRSERPKPGSAGLARRGQGFSSLCGPGGCGKNSGQADQPQHLEGSGGSPTRDHKAQQSVPQQQHHTRPGNPRTEDDLDRSSPGGPRAPTVYHDPEGTFSTTSPDTSGQSPKKEYHEMATSPIHMEGANAQKPSVSRGPGAQPGTEHSHQKKQDESEQRRHSQSVRTGAEKQQSLNVESASSSARQRKSVEKQNLGESDRQRSSKEGSVTSKPKTDSPSRQQSGGKPAIESTQRHEEPLYKPHEGSEFKVLRKLNSQERMTSSKVDMANEFLQGSKSHGRQQSGGSSKDQLTPGHRKSSGSSKDLNLPQSKQTSTSSPYGGGPATVPFGGLASGPSRSIPQNNGEDSPRRGRKGGKERRPSADDPPHSFGPFGLRGKPTQFDGDHEYLGATGAMTENQHLEVARLRSQQEEERKKKDEEEHFQSQMKKFEEMEGGAGHAAGEFAEGASKMHLHLG